MFFEIVLWVLGGFICYCISVRLIGVPWARISWKVAQVIKMKMKLRYFVCFPATTMRHVFVQFSNLVEKLGTGTWGKETPEPTEEPGLGMVVSLGCRREYILWASWLWPLKLIWLGILTLITCIALACGTVIGTIIALFQRLAPGFGWLLRFVSNVD